MTVMLIILSWWRLWMLLSRCCRLKRPKTSPTSQSCHQDLSSPTSVTNINLIADHTVGCQTTVFIIELKYTGYIQCATPLCASLSPIFGEFRCCTLNPTGLLHCKWKQREKMILVQNQSRFLVRDIKLGQIQNNKWVRFKMINESR